MEAHKAQMKKQDDGVIRLVRSDAENSTEVCYMYLHLMQELV